VRSCILAHSSWNGSGVSETRGSANPVAEFIAQAEGPTSMRAVAVAKGYLSTIGRLGNWFQGILHGVSMGRTPVGGVAYSLSISAPRHI
jgi:hypothetical protein